ncbi:MAG TPA: hypothetical protein DCM05_16890 [Elusimicrobia bacterium]|nr:hypothetical protein [Elusimicrobiota bacterium]
MRAALLGALLSALPCAASEPPVELRGVWLTSVDSSVLEGRKSIAEAMEFLEQHHFNAVFVVVWNSAYTLYPSRVMERRFGTAIHPRFAGRDPLADVVAEAHARGIAVIAWFEYGMAASYRAGGGPILKKNPSWAERDSSGKLLTKNGFEWLNGFHPEVQDFLLSLVSEVAENYGVDGIQGDDRLPAQPVEGGYSAYTAGLWAAEHGGAQPPKEPRDPAWMRWRADRLTRYAQALSAGAKKSRPGLVVSWSPGPYPWCYEEYLQDWPAWMKNNSGDIVHPQLYRRSFEAYKEVLSSQLSGAAGSAAGRMYPGMLISLGSWQAPEKDIVRAVQLNRERGLGGEVFFFFEGLRREGGKLAQALLAGPYAERAALPAPFIRRTQPDAASPAKLRGRAPGPSAFDELLKVHAGTKDGLLPPL